MSTKLQRVSTGVGGLDDILQGGLPAGHMYLLEGDPGTGKTTVAMQFLLAAVAKGNKVLYVTLSEPKQELLASAESHGWDLSQMPIVEFVRMRPVSRRSRNTPCSIPLRLNWPARSPV